MHHVIVLGTRPEIIKLSSLIRLLVHKSEQFTLIDTGQHYDYQISKIFYEELQIPQPDYFLDAPHFLPNVQLGYILSELWQILSKLKPDIVYSQGDTNSVLATAIATQRLLLPFVHIEAGIRSYDPTMPEEINRRVASICAVLHCCPTEKSAQNLRLEGIDPSRIEVTGNTVVDAITHYFDSDPPKSDVVNQIISSMGNKKFIILTMHRPTTVDDPKLLRKVLESLIHIPIPILFVMHPRTSSRIDEFGLKQLILNSDNIHLHHSIGYFDFLTLLSESLGVITDSGGVQEEAIALRIPCITLRPNTDRPEAVILGANILINPFDSNFSEDLLKVAKNLVNAKERISEVKNPYGDGNAAKRIFEFVTSKYNDELSISPPDYTKSYPRFSLMTHFSPKHKNQLGFDAQGSLIQPDEYKMKGKYFLIKSFERISKERDVWDFE